MLGILFCVCVCVHTSYTVHHTLSPCVESPTRAFVHCGRQVAEVWWVCYPSPTKTNIQAGPYKYCLLIQSSTYQGQALNSTHLVAQGWIDPCDSGLSMMHAPDVLSTNLSLSLLLCFLLSSLVHVDLHCPFLWPLRPLTLRISIRLFKTFLSWDVPPSSLAQCLMIHSPNIKLG